VHGHAAILRRLERDRQCLHRAAEPGIITIRGTLAEGSAVALVFAVLITVGSTAVVLTVVLFLRRIFPIGGIFTDSDRAAGIFGVLGTSFAVLLAFVIFLAFDSHGHAKDSAAIEAISVQELYRDAQLFPAETREELEGELICYARAVIDDGWRTMQQERAGSDLVDDWVQQLEITADRADTSDPEVAVGYQQWLDESSERRAGRRGRLSEATPFVPLPMWMALALGAVLLITYACCYADRGERFWAQAIGIGSLTAVVVAGLLTVRFFDLPYADVPGSVKPVEMERTAERLEDSREATGSPVTIPCDDVGRPV
jgi:Protein of unknown function (DUF4239)